MKDEAKKFDIGRVLYPNFYPLLSQEYNTNRSKPGGNGQRDVAGSDHEDSTAGQRSRRLQVSLVANSRCEGERGRRNDFDCRLPVAAGADQLRRVLCPALRP